MKRIRLVAVSISCLVILLVSNGCRKQNAEESGKTVEEMLAEYSVKTLEHSGTTYYLKDDIQTILLMGIDHEDALGTGNNMFGGQADAIGLLVIDQGNETFAILQIDRNTLCSVPVLNAEGDSIGNEKMQLCFAHAYGSGGKDSCENTCIAVSSLFDISIESYCALYMDAIPILNDAVGGVSVTIRDDFSQVDESLINGKEICLSGQQAYNYLRYRQQVGNGLNEGRLLRQKEYGEKYLLLLKDLVQDDTDFALKLYQDLQDDMVTSISGSDVNGLSEALKKYQNLGILTIDGVTKIENGWEVFYPDEDALQSIVLELFYIRSDKEM